jgi:DNA (cytosine-5)-methyltransferase 1
VPKNNIETFKFIDLFAGIGGFAAALTAFGGKPVYSVEIDPAAAKVYELNWGHSPLGDITVDANETTMNVPAHDILAAGFPCQPFSKSGAQRGMDETRGTPYWNILQIIQAHHPTIVLLENVRNLAGPRHKHEWEVIIQTLRDEGYRVSETPAVFSPHLLPKHLGGRPQIRERVFITATHNPKGIKQSEPVLPPVSTAEKIAGWNPQKWNLAKDLPLEPGNKIAGTKLSSAEIAWIDAWDEWVQLYYELSGGKNPPGFPIWADSWVDIRKLDIDESTPKWKANFLVKNAELYSAHKVAFDKWLKKHAVLTDKFPPSRRKLEWQAQDTPTLWGTVMHFRPSGIRAKKPTYLPALVAITQTSILGSKKRRLSTREAARLQGLPDNYYFGDQKDSATYKQLGNGVNVGVVWHVLKKHAERDAEILKSTKKGNDILKLFSAAPQNPDLILQEVLNKKVTTEP